MSGPLRLEAWSYRMKVPTDVTVFIVTFVLAGLAVGDRHAAFAS